MTEFSPSNKSEPLKESLRPQGAELENSAIESSEQKVRTGAREREVPATERPFIITEGGEQAEPTARPELFDEEAWSRLGPQTLYARLFRPFFNLTLLFIAALLAACSFVSSVRIFS